MKNIEMYQEWIEEDLEDIGELNDELLYWQKIYKKRVFDQSWPKNIKLVLDGIKIEIARQIDQVQYNLKRMEEIRNDKTRGAQLNQNQEDAGSAGPVPGDTYQELAGIEQETMGPPPEEVDNIGGENE